MDVADPHSPAPAPQAPTTQYRDVFLCHAGEQKRGLVSHLQSALHRNGITTFLDVDDIVSGQYSDETIQPAVENAKVVVAVITLDFIGKAYPMKELAWALGFEDDPSDAHKDATRDVTRDATRHAARNAAKRRKTVPVFYNDVGRGDCRKEKSVEEVELRLKQGAEAMVGREHAVLAAVVAKWRAQMMKGTAMEQVAALVASWRARVAEGRGRYALAAVKRWRVVLAEAASVGNKDQNDGHRKRDDTRLVDEVVKEVYSKLERHVVKQPRYTIALEEEDGHAAKFKTLLGTGGACGFFGQGGIGKTTLANAIISKLTPQFVRNDIAVEEVGTDISEQHLFQCAKNLLRQLGRDRDPHTPAEAFACLHQVLQPEPSNDGRTGRQVLLLLDNVWHRDQLAKLLPAGGPASLAPGTVVLCTSRQKKDLLFWFPHSNCHEVGLLSDEQARRMLRWYVFGQEDLEPPENLRETERKLLDACGNLPLALEVVGAYIHLKCQPGCYGGGQDKFAPGTWEDALTALQERHGDDDRLARVLSRSLEFLARQQVQMSEMFFDVACCLHGQPRDLLVPAWHGVYSGASTYTVDAWLDTLLNSCLLRQDLSGSLTAHDVLRALAQAEVQRGASYDCCQQRWLWDADAACEMLSNPNQVARGARAVTLTRCPLQEVQHNPFELNQTLRFLIATTSPQNEAVMDDDEILQHMLLRWEVDLPPGSSVHVHDMQYIRDMHSSGQSKSNGGWLGSELVTYPHTLVWLHLDVHAGWRTLPDSIAQLVSLRVLRLPHCLSLTSLPERIRGWSQLQVLDLSHCTMLSSLPAGISRLTSLKTLLLKGCERLRGLPEGMRTLRLLQTMDLSSCSELRTIPNAISNWAALATLQLSFCRQLQCLPDGISSLAHLHTLELCECRQLKSLPEGIGGSLQHLDLRCCVELECLPNSICCLGSLQSLDLTGCSKLQCLPKDIGSLSRLQKLLLSNCDQLQSLPASIGDLGRLQKLDCYLCRQLQALPDSLGNLGSLQILNLTYCFRLQSLPETIGSLSSLHTLGLSECDSLRDLPQGLSKLVGLTELNLWGCAQLSELPDGISHLTSLRQLKIAKYSQPMLPELVTRMTWLHGLDLCWCGQLSVLPEGISRLIHLQKLDLARCKRLRSLPEGISCLTGLTELKLLGCSALSTLPQGVGSMTKLQHLSVEECSSLRSLPGTMSGLTGLQRLNLEECDRLSGLPEGISCLTSLQQLSLVGCRAPGNLLKGISCLTWLHELDLRGADLRGCEHQLTHLPESIRVMRGQHPRISDSGLTWFGLLLMYVAALPYYLLVLPSLCIWELFTRLYDDAKFPGRRPP